MAKTGSQPPMTERQLPAKEPPRTAQLPPKQPPKK